MQVFNKKTVVNTCAATLSFLLCSDVSAQAFSNCPSEAFLVQDSVARIYGVNLATGYYEELSNDMGTTGKINAIGFNFHDDYIYGWGYQSGTIVRIGSDFIATPLTISNLPSTSFYVGDVALHENSYYMYRSGGSHGLYKVDLDPSSESAFTVQRIIDGSSLNLRIFDFAFHPTNNYLYSVDASGNLHRINPTTGDSESLANVGQSGTFGAVYFDVNENFYISRNSDGHIFRINVSDDSPQAEFFAFGPSSGNNDGARCALADIVTENSTIDFGDAPESYGTSIENNGARHEISNEIYLGQNETGSDDGIDFVTGFEAGLNTLMRVNAEGNGYLNSWVDWDRNGTFDSDEQVTTDMALDSGESRILIDVPVDAEPGDTWARFRYSSQTGIGATGGVSDGEVEDHQITLTSSGISIISYPSANNFVTLAYEDNWPLLGDYDMNDAVIAYQTRRYIDENQNTVRYDIEGNVLAIGASYHSGFAVQLDGIATSNVASSLMRYEINGVQQDDSALESNDEASDAVIVVTQDLWDSFSVSNGCQFYRTEDGCEEQQNFSFLVSVPLVASVADSDAPKDVLNPFIFATPGLYHGEGFPTPPGRSLEIHLKNKPVTARFDTSFWGMAQDDSDNVNGRSFVTTNNMPWALELPTTWDHPLERIDIMDAYPNFTQFVASDGEENTTWYLNSQAISDRIMVNQ